MLTHRSGSDFGSITSKILRELAGVIAKLLSTIYQHSWLSGEVPKDWRLADVTPFYKKGRKEDPGNYRPVSLTSASGKVTKQIILGEITGHVHGFHEHQHGFMKGRSCLTNLISYNW